MSTFDAPATPAPAGRSPLLPALVFVAVALAAEGAWGLWLGHQAIAGFRELGRAYDEQYDPVVIRDGQVSAGPRIVHYVEDGKHTLLVDPDETVPDEAITTPEAFIVRRDTFTRVQPMRVQTTAVADMQQFFGIAEVVIDSAHVLVWLEQNASWMYVGGVAIGLGLGLLGVVELTTYSLVAAALIAGARQVPSRDPVSRALTVSTALIAARVAARAGGFPVGCAGLVLWPALILGALAIWTPKGAR